MSKPQEPRSLPAAREVKDEEGTVDRKLKDRILKSRNRIDDREDILFTQAKLDPQINISHEDAVEAWGNSVRQYIRSIEPVLRSDEIGRADFYYKEMVLGEETLTPPDTSEYDFSLFAEDSVSNTRLMMDMGLPHTFEPPEAVTVTFQGLVDIIELETIGHEWVVQTEKHDFRNESVERLSVSRPVPKYVLENAVRAADQFLQEAGIGLEIGEPDEEFEEAKVY